MTETRETMGTKQLGMKGGALISKQLNNKRK
jgi:hypothetical protein